MHSSPRGKVYLDKQNEDLERALTTLQNAIKKIDQETRARFKETLIKSTPACRRFSQEYSVEDTPILI